MKNRRKQNFEGEANNWIKKILDEAFNMFNKLTCKVRFHIAV